MRKPGVLAAWVADRGGRAARYVAARAAGRNSGVVQRHLLELWQAGRTEIAEELFDPDFTDHNPVAGQPGGLPGLLMSVRAIKTAFPEQTYDVIKLVPVGDMVVCHWRFRGRNTGPIFGRLATGRAVEFCGTDMFRLRKGRILDLWHVEELLELQTQLGLVQATASPEVA